MGDPYPNLKMVPLDALVPNPWNPNEMDPLDYEKAKKSIRKFGFVDPVTVRQMGDVWEIVDGENRWRAARDCWIEDIPIFDLGKISDEDAKELTIVLNELRGRPNPRKLADLVRDLAQKRSTLELEEILPFRRQQLAEMVAERREEIDWDALAKPREAPSSSGDRWVERIYRLPLSAAEVVDAAIGRVKDEGVEDWRALELICADYLASG